MGSDQGLPLSEQNAAAPAATVVLRVMAGGVFVSEGILKFVYANQGVGRFTKLGLPFPAMTATGIGILEIAGGVMLIVGLMTRAMSVIFIGEMIVAILTTKVSLYLGTSPLPLPSSPPQVGFWAVMHEIRSDYAQVMTCVFLLVVGPGKWSVDWLMLSVGGTSRIPRTLNVARVFGAEC